MKTFALFSLLSLVSFSVCAEKPVGSYYNQYFDVTYKIEASEIENDKFTVYIQVGAKSKNRRAMLAVDSDKLDAFKAGLWATKEKFTEWSAIAKTNNVTELNKEMDITLPDLTACWLGSKWFFAFNQRLKPKFLILDDGRHVVTFVKKVASSSNEYIDETIYWVFSSPEEIDELSAQLDIDKIKAQLLESSKKSDLFD